MPAAAVPAHSPVSTPVVVCGGEVESVFLSDVRVETLMQQCFCRRLCASMLWHLDGKQEIVQGDQAQNRAEILPVPRP